MYKATGYEDDFIENVKAGQILKEDFAVLVKIYGHFFSMDRLRPNSFPAYATTCAEDFIRGRRDAVIGQPSLPTFPVVDDVATVFQLASSDGLTISMTG